MMLICGCIFWWKSKAVKSTKCSTWMQCQKWQNDLCSFLRQTIQYHSNPSLCPTSNAEEAEVERFYEDLKGLELTPPEDVLFIIVNGMQKWEVKRRLESGQIWPWSTKWTRTKAKRVFPRECTDHCKHWFPTTQEKTLHTDITRRSILKSDWLCSL